MTVVGVRTVVGVMTVVAVGAVVTGGAIQKRTPEITRLNNMQASYMHDTNWAANMPGRCLFNQ